MINGRRIIFLALVLIALFSAWYFISPMFQQPIILANVATVITPARPLTSFNLVDTRGQDFTQQSLRGHWTIIFFGYTNCPDICPATLGLMREAWNSYAPAAPPPVRFVFADIAKQTVSSADLKIFLNNYNPTFIGISGTSTNMAQLSDQLGIFQATEGGKINHTAALMLIDPQARLSAIFTPPFSAQDLVKDLDLLTRTKH